MLRFDSLILALKDSNVFLQMREKRYCLAAARVASFLVLNHTALYAIANCSEILFIDSPQLLQFG